jgi:hypothetical protein
MNRRTRENLLWGVVGALSFLVLVQGYELLTEAAVTVGVKAGVALLVGVAAAVVSHLARDRLVARRQRRAETESPGENESP